MKITEVTPYVSMPISGLPWLFVEVKTDNGLVGVGECSDYASTGLLVKGIEWIKREVIGQDARNIENIWQTIFHKYDDMNGRGYISHLISAIDIALWDIKGKALGAPIYQLLGGPVRERVPLYTHVQDFNSNAGGPDVAAKAALLTKEAGYKAIKTDPFPTQDGPDAGFSGPAEVERLTPENLRKSVEWMDTIRGAVGPDFELMVDAHARFDVASAIEAARALEHINLIWLEEPIHVENHNALRQVRENVRVPLCIGERHFTRWDYTEVINNRLVDYIMPDVAWCGGISELRRIASMAEAQFIRISPHDALGPVSIAAGFQVCMTTPNLYRQECLHTWFDTFEKMINPMFDVRDGSIYPTERPGLGIELNMDSVQRYLVDPDTREYLNIDSADEFDTGKWIQ